MTASTQRVEAFSDAVIAIVLTLMSVELLRIEPHEGVGTLAATVAGAWPAYLAYVVSYVIIAQIWLSHHNLWRLIARVDQRLLALNLALLMVVAVIPFAAKLLAEALSVNDGDDRQFASTLYAAVVLVEAVLFNILWRYAEVNHLLEEDVPYALIKIVSRRYLLGPLLYVLALGLSFVNAWLSLASYFALALGYILPGSGELEKTLGDAGE